MANPSRFAHMFRAYEFAYGISPVNCPGLIVDGGNAAAGTATVTLATGQTQLGDGTVLFPLNTNAPIKIGIGTNQETVTPSGVGNPTLPGYTQSTITATFANAHGTGDLITSGTAGLQEALNFASSVGGGVVIIDSAWTSIGGTDAMVAAATIPATVVIVDNRPGRNGGVQQIVVSIPNAQVLTLFSVGVDLLPAPGANNAWDVIDMVLENVFLTGAFAAGGAIQASYGTGVTNPATATIAATFLTSPTANQMIKVAGALASTAAASIKNQKIRLAAATADFTTGAGSLKVYLSYRLLTNLS